jgi:hypothetical protein
MLHFARRLLTAPLLVAALGGAVAVAPGAANAAGITATVKVASTLKVRSAPTLASKVVGSVRGGQRITVACQVAGQKVRGSVRTTTAWDRLADGTYLSHAYASSAKSIPVCAAASKVAVPTRKKTATKAVKPTYVAGTVKSDEGNVNIRSVPNKQGVKLGSVATGAKVNLVCAATGQLVDGTLRTTSQWDKTTTGGWLSHAFISSATLKPCTGSALPPPAVELTPQQFIAAAVPGAQRGWREFGVPASVTLAQSILESGWGRSGLSSVDKNYFGIKCQSGRFGTIANGCHVYVTDECTKAGTCFSTSAAFRTYATQTHSFRDHGSFLRVNPRYAPAFAYTKDANKFIWNVWKAGYATDPQYYTKVTSLMASWNLYQYDTWK